jgi:hypothetical protein
MSDESVVPAGAETSEKAVAKSSSVWGIVAMILGILVTTGSSVAAGLGADTKVGIIVGAVVTVGGIIQKTLTDLGYIGSRTAVKKSFYENQ